MKVRTKALVEIGSYVIATLALVFSLNYFFPKYGFIIYILGLACYFVYLMYKIRVNTLEREQEEIVDTLKR